MSNPPSNQDEEFVAMSYTPKFTYNPNAPQPSSLPPPRNNTAMGTLQAMVRQLEQSSHRIPSPSASSSTFAPSLNSTLHTETVAQRNERDQIVLTRLDGIEKTLAQLLDIGGDDSSSPSSDSESSTSEQDPVLVNIARIEQLTKEFLLSSSSSSAREADDPSPPDYRTLINTHQSEGDKKKLAELEQDEEDRKRVEQEEQESALEDSAKRIQLRTRIDLIKGVLFELCQTPANKRNLKPAPPQGAAMEDTDLFVIWCKCVYYGDYMQKVIVMLDELREQEEAERQRIRSSSAPWPADKTDSAHARQLRHKIRLVKAAACDYYPMKAQGLAKPTLPGDPSKVDLDVLILWCLHGAALGSFNRPKTTRIYRKQHSSFGFDQELGFLLSFLQSQEEAEKVPPTPPPISNSSSSWDSHFD